MRHTYTVASLNINGIANHTRIKMLEDFLWTHDIDIALLQEVTCPQLCSVVREGVGLPNNTSKVLLISGVSNYGPSGLTVGN